MNETKTNVPENISFFSNEVTTVSTEAPLSIGMSSTYVSESTHRYVVETTDSVVATIKSQFEIACEPLTAFRYKAPSPEDERDVKVGRRIDDANASIYEHNQRVVQLVNPVLVGLHHRPIKAHPPDKSYASEARRKFKEWLKDPTVRLREAIRYLAKREQFDPETDLDDAADKADGIAAGEEKERLKYYWHSDGRSGVPVTGPEEKTTWNGISERDSADNRVQWRITEYHSFLQPHVIPETW